MTQSTGSRYFQYALAVCLVVSGCAPVVGLTSWAGMAGTLVVLGLLLLPGRSRAELPPMSVERVTPPGGVVPPKCTGRWHEQCVDGRVSRRCCPRGAKCNYRNAPFVSCGYDTCVPGHDIGLCPEIQPRLAAPPGAKKEDCTKGTWEKACVNKVVRDACIQYYPTNYSGTPYNPKFTTCGENRCTTRPTPAACEPVKVDGAVCSTSWAKTCLDGKVTERCLPEGTYPSTLYTECEDKCVVGKGTSCR